MAQVPKQRIVLYVVLAVIVLGFGVWFVLQSQKQKREMSGMRVRPHQVARLSESLRRELRAASRKTEGIAGAAELIASIEAEIAEFSAAYNETDSAPSDQLTEKHKEINSKLRELRKLRKTQQ